MSDLALQTLKDPYLFDFMNIIEAEFALRGINKPMGVSEFQFTEFLPEDLRSGLPTIEEIESEFENLR